jgi:hypothetical protein
MQVDIKRIKLLICVLLGLLWHALLKNFDRKGKHSLNQAKLAGFEMDATVGGSGFAGNFNHSKEIKRLFSLFFCLFLFLH